MDCRGARLPSPDPKSVERGKTQQLTGVGREWNRAEMVCAHKLDKQQTLPSTRGLPKLGWGLSPPQADTSEKGVKWRKGCSSAPTPSPRLGVAARSGSPSCTARSRSPLGGGPGGPRVQRQEDPGALAVPKAGGGCGSTHQFGFVFRFLFVGGPAPHAPLVAPAPTGFLAAASRSRRRRPGLLHLSPALSPVPRNPTSPPLRQPRVVPRPRADSGAPLPGRACVCLGSSRLQALGTPGGQAPLTPHAFATTRRRGKPCP